MASCLSHTHMLVLSDLRHAAREEVAKKDIGRCFKEIVQWYKDKAQGDGG